MSSLTNPYNIANSPAAPAKLTPLLYTDAFTGTFSTTVAYAYLLNGQINLASSVNIDDVGIAFPFNRVVGYDFIPFSAGVLGQWTIDFTGVTVVTNSQYNIIINSGNDALAGSGLGIGTNVVFSTTVSTTASLAQAFLNSLAGLVSGGYLTATITGSVVTIVEANLVTAGFSFYPSAATIAITNTVAHVSSSGTPAQVALYVPSITTGTYDMYVWKLRVGVNQADGVHGDTFEYIVEWGDSSQTNYTDFKATMNSFGNNAGFISSTYSQVQMQDLFGFPQ